MSDGSFRRVDSRRFLTNLILPELVIVAMSLELLIWAMVCLNCFRGIFRIAKLSFSDLWISNNPHSEHSKWVFSDFSNSSLVGVLSILKPIHRCFPLAAFFGFGMLLRRGLP